MHVILCLTQVATYPMNLTQMLKHLDDGVYELNRGGPDLFIQDLCLTLHDCRASNVVRGYG